MKEPLLRIHIDDISNVKPITDTNILPRMKDRLSELNIRIAKDNMHIVMPATSRCIISIDSIFRINKTLIETGDTDIRYDGGEEALDKKDIDLPKPIYGRGYPRLNNKNGFTYKHMRDMADNILGK